MPRSSPRLGPTVIAGAYGTLQIAADGTYSYTANVAAAEALAGGARPPATCSHTRVGDPKAEDDTATLTFTITGVG